MYLSIIFMPLIGSITSGFLGRKLGTKGAQVITTASVFLTTMLALVAYFEVSLNQTPVSIHLFRWIDSENLHVSWGFNFDSLTVSMLIPVLIVSSLVHLYSIGYMNNDPHNQRFFSYLSLFTFMMIILVTGNNYLLMFVGWEGVGVCSYLLVSFWFTRIAANQSSLAAFLTNRVGDCFLTIGMFVLLLTFGNINYNTIFSLTPYISEDIITLIGILLLLGAMAKSSQIGLHVWLPMAMEGPTPVSALIHAATMVTAGVYLLMRSSPLIEYSSTVLLLCLWIGAITTVFSSLIGLFQQDIKKVIAYSTMSQLGMMVIAVGLSSYNLALFHLVNHAFYKALLFLGAGSVIHAVADNQDFRKYGGLRAFLPLTYSVMLIASLSLVAFPFMTGFYSKDFILESAYGNFSYSTTSVYFIALIGAMFTTLYSVKVLYLTFLTTPNGPQSSYKIAHEGDIYMSLPLIILAIFSIGFGYLTKDLFIGLGTDVFSDNSIFIHPNHEITLDTEFAVPHLFKLLPLAFTITLSLIYIAFSEFIFTKAIISFKLSRFGYNVYSFFNQRFLIEAFYNKFITNAILNVGGQTTKVIDKGSVELLGPFGLETLLIYISKKVNNLSINLVTTYALFITIAVVSYLTLTSLAGLDNLGLFSLFPMILPTGYRANRHSLFHNAYSKAFFSCTAINHDTNNGENDRRLREEEMRRHLEQDREEEMRRRFAEAEDSDVSMGDASSVNSDIVETRDFAGNFDPNNGLELDDPEKIKENCTTEGEINAYFDTKLAAFNNKYQNDVDSYLAEDEDDRYSDDLEHWKSLHERNVEALAEQKKDLMLDQLLIQIENEPDEENSPNSPNGPNGPNDPNDPNDPNGGDNSNASFGGSPSSGNAGGPTNPSSNNRNMELPLDDKAIKDIDRLSDYYPTSEVKVDTTSLEKFISIMLKLINELFTHYI